jgi:GTP cyclohydrolase I
MDVNKLLKALDDETNENLLDFTSKKMKEMNLKIIKELQLPRDETLDIMKKMGSDSKEIVVKDKIKDRTI